MRASQACLDLIKESEQLVLGWYQDTGGVWTIGYGHARKPGDNFIGVTPEGAEALLREDLKDAEDAVNTWVNVPLTQGQFDALVDFTFNLGARQFRDSTLLKLLNGGDYEGAAKQFGRWVYDAGKVQRGLVTRREKERKMFLGTIAPGLVQVAELHQE